MNKSKTPWFRLSVTCNLDTCALLMKELTNLLPNSYEDLSIYDCIEPQHAADEPEAEVRPFGCPD